VTAAAEAVTWITEIGFPAPDAGPLHTLFAPMPAPEPLPEPELEAEP
jgi:hypothetical protein